MSAALPAAVALADQMQAAVIDRARRAIAIALHGEDLPTPTEDEQALIDMGIAAGMTLTMQVLVEMGLLKTANTP